MRLLSTLAAAAAVSLATSAMAADLPVIPAQTAPAPAPVSLKAPSVPPIFTWTGAYGGVNLGYGISDSKLKLGASTTPFFADALNVAGFGNGDKGGFTGGAQVGYNYQVGTVVYGIEADVNYSHLRDKHAAFAAWQVGPNTAAERLSAQHRVNWYGTLRPRIGFTTSDDLMIYATGGLAFGGVKGKSSYLIGVLEDPTNDVVFSGRKSQTRLGWTVGAGAEYAVTDKLSLKGEYLYVNLGTDKYTARSATRTDTYRVKDETNFHVVRAGLNYKFW